MPRVLAETVPGNEAGYFLIDSTIHRATDERDDGAGTK